MYFNQNKNTMPLTNHIVLKRYPFLVCLSLFFLAACQAGASVSKLPEEESVAQTAPTNTNAATPITMPKALPASSVETATTPSNTEKAPVQSAFEPRPLSAAKSAIAALVGHLGVDADGVEVVSIGDWSEAQISCELDIPNERAGMLLGGKHVRVELAYKNRSFVYWVFNSSPDLNFAFLCK